MYIRFVNNNNYLHPLGTSGIGRAIVLALTAHNTTHIYFTGRSISASKGIIFETKKLYSSTCSPLTFIQIDLSTTREDIRTTLAAKFHSSRLDILIANARIMAVPQSLTAEGFEVQFGTNYLGHAVLLQLLRPLMLRTVRGDGSKNSNSNVRFVAVSSFGHTMVPASGIEFDKFKLPDAGTKWIRYGQSKLADILLAKGMAKRYLEILSVSVHPGLVRTQLGGRAERSAMLMVMELLRWTPLYQSPQKGAQNVLWAATAAKSKLEGGQYYEPVGKISGKPNVYSGMAAICDDEWLADELWEWTKKELVELEAL